MTQAKHQSHLWSNSSFYVDTSDAEHWIEENYCENVVDHQETYSSNKVFGKREQDNRESETDDEDLFVVISDLKNDVELHEGKFDIIKQRGLNEAGQGQDLVGFYT